MNEEKLMKSFENMTPDEDQKVHIWNKVLNRPQLQSQKKKGRIRAGTIAAATVCGVIALWLWIGSPFGTPGLVYAVNVILDDGAVIQLPEWGGGTTNDGDAVSYVDARPGLEFYIDGEHIAKIEISTETEFITAVDWTMTQDRKFWDHEYAQIYDEDGNFYGTDFDLLYDKNIVLSFEEGFSEYDRIWYRWKARNMYKWAAADNYAYLLGFGIPSDVEVPSSLDGLSEQEKAALAAGDGKFAGLGHIQLDEYPDHLRKDIITIQITDRNGNVSTQQIHVEVSNNELRQTVVTARLVR